MTELITANTGSRGRKALGAALVAVAALALPALAQDAGRNLPGFGMMGLARGQVAVLSLVDTDTTADRAACQITAAFVDARGQVFSDAAGNGVQRTFTLRPNLAVTLRLRAADILAPGQNRRSTRVVLSSPGGASTIPCGCVVATREMVNQDGTTSSGDVGIRDDGGGNPPPPPCIQGVGPSPPPGR